MLGELIIPVDSFSISSGIGLSITGELMLSDQSTCSSSRRSWVRSLVATLFFFSNVDLNNEGSSTVQLLSTQIWMKERICGALVQFGCCQHRYKWKGLWSLVQFGHYQHRHEWMLRPHPYSWTIMHVRTFVQVCTCTCITNLPAAKLEVSTAESHYFQQSGPK